jgi:hypothetical protein
VLLSTVSLKFSTSCDSRGFKLELPDVPIWSGHPDILDLYEMSRRDTQCPDIFQVSLSDSLFNDSYKATLGNISQEFLEGKLEVSVIPLMFQEKFLLYTKQMS